MTFEELVKKYGEQILSAKDKKKETQKVIQKIDNLIYTESNQKISDEDKIRILNELRKEVTLLEHTAIFAQDNKDYLDLIDQTIKALGGK
ncbi:MAG: hypothetical protein UH080_07950 [Ruminococcus sp.]|nr:hypothetical protein [Ruminococcus sp.]